MNNKVIAFIPLRGGSKSIPLKNIKSMNGRPLAYWVLDAATRCSYVDEVVVSTDDEGIKSCIKRYNHPKVVVYDRSRENASDIASTESAMIEYAETREFQDIILIQATSPLLQSEDLKNGIEKYKEKNIDSVLSVVRQKRFIWEETVEGAKSVNYRYDNRPRRQDFQGYLVENGAFYITSRDRLLKSKCRISGNIGVVEMDSTSYIEIDEVNDWWVVETILKNREKYNCEKRIKMLLTDSDGVLTDGGMYYSENGDELKKFNTKDGMGLEQLRKRGVITGIITGENRELVRARGNKLKVDELFMGIKNKIEIVEELCSKYGISIDEVAYIGDDINDIEVISRVGLGVAVSDAMESVKDIADHITIAKGGEGAVREVCELIIRRDMWERAR